MAVLGVAAPVAVGVRWWDQPPGAPLLYLSADEEAFFDALADGIFPEGGEPALSGRQARVGRYVDALLGGMIPFQRNLFRVAVHGLNALALAQAGSTVDAMPPADAAAMLSRWLVADDCNLRGIAQSLHIFIGMGYLAHPAVAPVIAAQFACGFGGRTGGFGYAE
jgi:hypothetical protein